jgi:hypothetical protein
MGMAMKMMTTKWVTAVAVAASLTLVAAACGDSESASSPVGDTDSGDMDSGDMDSGDMDSGDMDSMSDSEDHEHGEITEWPSGTDLPELELTVEPTEGGAVDIDVTAEGFDVIPAGAEASSPAQGHLHVAVDGREVGMFYDLQISLTNVDPGDHEVVVTLSGADHTTLGHNGSPITFTSTFTMPGEVTEADLVIDIVVDADGKVAEVVEAKASIGELIQINITSAVADELHVHAYEVKLDVHAGMERSVEFEADIPGVFEIELEGSGVLVAKLQVS